MEINVASLLASCYEPGDGTEEGAQIVNGEWYYPAWGCDSLERVLDRVVSMLKKKASDEYHSLEELYHHRHALCLALMKMMPEHSWFSRRHNDGELCFGDGEWLIIGIDLPSSRTITYHIPIELLETVKATSAQELEVGKQWDGHTSNDVVERLLSWVKLPTYQLSAEDLDDLYKQVCLEITRVEDNND